MKRSKTETDENGRLGGDHFHFIEKNILGISERRMVPISEKYTKADLRHIAEDLIENLSMEKVLSFVFNLPEFYNEYEGDKRGAWQDYYTYGGIEQFLLNEDLLK